MHISRFILAYILITIGIGIILGLDVSNYIWPTVLILLGLNLIFNNRNHEFKGCKFERQFKVDLSDQDYIDYSVIFNSLNKKIISDDFKGGQLKIVFGEATLDLSECKIAKNKTAKLEINPVFGGFTIIVPKSWQVETSTTQVAGVFENKTKISGKVDGKLLITGSAVFAGGEIIN
jgi:predicted membrane protein